MMKKILILMIMCLPFFGNAQLSYTEDTSITFADGAYGSYASADTNNDGIVDVFTYTAVGPAFPSFPPPLNGENLLQNNAVFSTGDLPFTRGQFDSQVYADFNNNGVQEYLHFYADENYIVGDANGHPLSEAHVELIVTMPNNRSHAKPTDHGLPAVAAGIVLVGHYDSDNLIDVFVNGLILDINDIDNDGDTTDRARFAAWYKNNGDLTFTLMQTFVGLSRVSGVSGNIDAAYGDDIICSGVKIGGDLYMYYLQNNGSGFNVIELNSSNGWTPVSDGSIALGYDVPGARATYIAILGASSSGTGPQLRKDTGTGLFEQVLTFPGPKLFDPSIVFTHSDNDGHVDLYIQGRDNSNVFHADIYKNMNGVDGVNFLLQPNNFPGLYNGFAAELKLNNTHQPALIVNGIGQDGLSVTKLYVNNSQTLSIDEHALDNDMSLYPNPARDMLNIKLKNSMQLESIKIFDISGREVVSTHQSSVDVSRLGAGMYIVRLRAANGEHGTKKFVKI